jgi:hypothetical protein
VDPVPDPLLLRKSGSAGNRTRTSGSVASNSDTASETFHSEILAYLVTQDFSFVRLSAELLTCPQRCVRQACNIWQDVR